MGEDQGGEESSKGGCQGGRIAERIEMGEGSGKRKCKIPNQQQQHLNIPISKHTREFI